MHAIVDYAFMRAEFVSQIFLFGLTIVHCTLSPRDLKCARTVDLIILSSHKTFLTFLSTHSADGAAAAAEEAPKKKKKKKAIEVGEQAAADVARAVVEKTEGDKKKKKKKKAVEA